MPFFIRAEMNNHIAKSGKNIDSSKSHSIPTIVRKATMFLNDESLKNLPAASDNTYFYLCCQCHHSFKKNDPPHNLKVAFLVERSRMPLALVLLARSGFATIFWLFC